MDYLIYSVEDDHDIAHIINVALTKQGYQIQTFYDGMSFLTALASKKPNMILLDMMLPDISGSEIIKRIRANNYYDDVEIIIVSANRMVMDKVDGLDLGADDYIEKPFNILELMSRINAKVRRFQKNRIIKIKDYSLDLDRLVVMKNEDIIPLTSKEFEILSLLFLNKDKVLSRDEIFMKIWGQAAFESRTIDMHIKSLRKKLKDEKGDFIQTIYGIGYKLKI